jgi:purine-cytosine permease-like protein
LKVKSLVGSILIVGLAVWIVARWTALLVTIVVLLIVALVLRVADGVAAKGADAAANEGTFKTASALIADDTADSSAAESTHDRARLGIRASGA